SCAPTTEILTRSTSMTNLRRRDLLTGTALLLVSGGLSEGRQIEAQLPWHPGARSAPQPVTPGPWEFFTDAEAAAIEAIADRFIPPDPQTLGGKDAGCAVFIDRQLAGPYGQREGLYVAPPYEKGGKQQGPQSATGPAELYRKGLRALDDHVRAAHPGHSFATLSAEQQDEI